MSWKSPSPFYPSSSRRSIEEVAQKKPEVGKLEPLPENWMLRKSVPKSEEKSNSPGLRSLIQNAWLSEIPGEDQEGPPTPPEVLELQNKVPIFYPEQLRLALMNPTWGAGQRRWFIIGATILRWIMFQGSSPRGEVFVLVSLNRSGELNTYEVTQIHVLQGRWSSPF